MTPTLDLRIGDALTVLKTLPAESVQICVTSPPYFGLRDYGTGTWTGGDANCDHVVGELRRGVNLANSVVSTRGGAKKIAETPNIQARALCPKCGATRVDSQIGHEETPQAYVEKLVAVFREVRRVLRDDGVLWLNLGDSYANDGKWGGSSGGKHVEALHGNTGIGRGRKTTGLKSKDLIMIPQRVAMALQNDGWFLRSQIPWLKRCVMPESVTDRPTTSLEYVFLLTKNADYYYDHVAVKVPCDSGPSDLKKMVEQKDRIDAKHFHDDPGPLASANHRTNVGNKRGVGSIAGRNRRNGDWFFESFRGLLENEDGEPLAFLVNTQAYSGAHFATFPPKLVEPMILAGTSARGCCPHCGKPWERLTEKTDIVDTANKGSYFDRGKTGERDGGERTQKGERFVNKDIGWNPACECAPHDPIPCVVLDIFGGSGTVGQVSLEHGRSAILIELNPAYEPLIRQRCAITPGLALA